MHRGRSSAGRSAEVLLADLVVPIVTLFCLAAMQVRAEQPDLATLASKLYVTLPHFGVVGNPAYSGPLPTREGIWTIDTQRFEYTRVAPLYLQHPCGLIDCSWGASLTALDDRFVVQAWPASLEVEASTKRLVRRYAALSDPSLSAWYLFGAAVSPGSSANLGLAPGSYGHPQCAFDVILGEAPYGECDPTRFPGAEEAASHGDPRLVLHQPLATDRGALGFAARLTSGLPASAGLGGYQHTSLSFDGRRGGLWAAAADTVAFYPTAGGTISEPSRVTKPTLPPTAGYSSRISSWFYHPARDRFYAVLVDVNSVFATRGFRQAIEMTTDFALSATLPTHSPYETPPGVPIPETFAALPGTLPTTYEQLIPIVAHTSGQRGTYWTSELWLFNPSAAATTVAVRRVAAPGVERTIELGGHASLHVRDALAWIGGGPGGDGVLHDALVLTSPYRWGEQVVAASRTATPDRGGGGTMGHAVNAVPTRLGYTNHLASLEFLNGAPANGRPSEILLDLREPGRFRHNLGIVNDSDEPLTVSLRWGFRIWDWHDNPPEGGVPTLSVPAHRVSIVNVEALFPETLRDRLPPRIAVAGSRPAVITLSQIDNLTGDVAFVPFTTLFLQGDDDKRAAVPVVAHNEGLNGTRWRTDLYASFWDEISYWEGEDEDRPKAWFHPVWPDLDCGVVPPGGELQTYLDGTVGMPLQKWIEQRTYPGYPPPTADQAESTWQTVFPDVVRLFPPCASDDSVRGSLELRAGSWMSAYTRTYTTRSDGGTYGDVLPLYPFDGWPVQHFAGIEISPAFRINLGMFNGNRSQAITHRLTLYAADGRKLAEREITLRPWENVQERLEVMLGIPIGSIPVGTYGLTVLPLDDPAVGVEGRSWAYVSMVDNVSGDPTNWW